ncbi:MAG: hypothetical protein IT374_00360 [Polyangiaceae bacterium]|nr:hypothetical protein [Polyangiaceae bacterium]
MTTPRAPLPDGVLAVRPLPGANCSSVGSVVDMLFVAGVVASSVAVAVAALSAPEPAPAPEEPRDAGEG